MGAPFSDFGGGLIDDGAPVYNIGEAAGHTVGMLPESDKPDGNDRGFSETCGDAGGSRNVT